MKIYVRNENGRITELLGKIAPLSLMSDKIHDFFSGDFLKDRMEKILPKIAEFEIPASEKAEYVAVVQQANGFVEIKYITADDAGNLHRQEYGLSVTYFDGKLMEIKDIRSFVMKEAKEMWLGMCGLSVKEISKLINL